MEIQIKEALILLMEGIKAHDARVVTEQMARIEEAASAGRASLHPQLIHFLAGRSYAKALLFLGGEPDIPTGVCGGRVGKG